MRQKSPVQGWRQRSGNVRKHTFVVFHFPEIHIFAICGKTKGGLEKMTHLKKSAFTSRTYLAKNSFHEWFTSLPFWGKTHFFKQIFNSRYLEQLLKYWHQIRTARTKQIALSEIFFYLFIILKIRLATKSKVRDIIFLKKRVCFQNFGEVIISLNSAPKSPFR